MEKAPSLVLMDRYCRLYGEMSTLHKFQTQVGYSRIYEKQGYVQFSLSRTNMNAIKEFFPAEKPKIVKGQENLGILKSKTQKWMEQGELIRRVCAKPGSLKPGEEQLVLPHQYDFKMPPKDHQHKVFMLLTQLNQVNVSLDCGTGKTFILLTSTEYKLQKNKVSKGKTLISCPLSIIETSWMEDAEKFTGLKLGILWSNLSAKRELGEKIILKDHGPKPVFVSGSKTKRRTGFMHNQSSQILEELGPFDDEDDFSKVQITYKVGINEETKEEQRFGQEYAQTFTTINRKREHMQAMLDDDSYDAYIINHDGVRIYQDILAAHGFNQVIIDEATKIKNPQAKVFKAHVKISAKAQFRYPMSGTPAPNGALDLWGQFFFADRGMTLEPHISDYKRLFFTKTVLGERRVAGSDKAQEISRWDIKDNQSLKQIAYRLRYGAIRYRQDECLDLPERQNLPKAVVLSEELTRAYLEMEKNLLAEFVDADGNRMAAEASTALVKALRLRQINSGFVSAINEDELLDENASKSIATFKSNPKIEALESIVDEIGENKVVVVCNYTYEIKMLMDHFKSLNPSFINGQVKAKDRAPIVSQFQKSDTNRMIMLHPAAAAHGITLTRARYMVFFSMTNNYEHEYQVAKRIERIGQVNRMTMFYLQGVLNKDVVGEKKNTQTIDHSLYDLIRQKESVQENLIDNPHADFDFKSMLYEQVLDQMMGRHNE